MSKSAKNFRTPVANARGLGAAHNGTHHWWMQRLTSLALIPLMFYIVSSFLRFVVQQGYGGAMHWLRDPVSAAFVVLFLAVGFHHKASGLQVVIEDYVHCECAKLSLVIAVKFASAALALLGILATAKILFGA